MLVVDRKKGQSGRQRGASFRWSLHKGERSMPCHEIFTQVVHDGVSSKLASFALGSVLHVSNRPRSFFSSPSNAMTSLRIHVVFITDV